MEKHSKAIEKPLNHKEAEVEKVEAKVVKPDPRREEFVKVVLQGLLSNPGFNSRVAVETVAKSIEIADHVIKILGQGENHGE